MVKSGSTAIHLEQLVQIGHTSYLIDMAMCVHVSACLCECVNACMHVYKCVHMCVCKSVPNQDKTQLYKLPT